MEDAAGPGPHSDLAHFAGGVPYLRVLQAAGF